MIIRKLFFLILILAITVSAMAQTTQETVERTLFDALYQLSVIEKRASKEAAAIVYAITMRDYESQGGDPYYLRSVSLQDYRELRDDLLYNLRQIDRRLSWSDLPNVMMDYKLYSNTYDPTGGPVIIALGWFNSPNSRRDFRQDYIWVWERINYR